MTGHGPYHLRGTKAAWRSLAVLAILVVALQEFTFLSFADLGSTGTFVKPSGGNLFKTRLARNAAGITSSQLESETEVFEENGVKLLPSHKWKAGMHPVIHASRTQGQFQYPPWNRLGAWPVVIGIAADSGSGATTFIQRIMGTLGTEVDPGHTLVGDIMTVINLDDYRIHDRDARQCEGVSACNLKEVDLDLMRLQISALKEGKAIYKPVYNHATGLKETPELVEPNKIIVIEGLHPLADERLRKVIDFSVFIDIPHPMKYFWKAKAEAHQPGITSDVLKAEINANREDFKRYVEPQKANADMILKYDVSDKGLPYLKVSLIQRKRPDLPPLRLTDSLDLEGLVGSSFRSYESTWYGQPVSVIEMDGEFHDSEADYQGELLEVERHLGGLIKDHPKELSEAMLKMKKWGLPGSFDGTGLFQTVLAFKLRELIESKN